ncbi:MAG: transposase [Desulfobacterales bacterium]|jgi:REP element-mobilizing transposase RayT
MPRKARIDAPGALHHIIVRGIERRKIFFDNADRENFLERLGIILTETRTPCFAWALIPNHLHLLLRTGSTPIANVMRRLLTGYAVTFNRRHRRHGQLFQNRYKSILCQEDLYLLELVRYIHLNPLRAKIVKELKELDKYSYCGHSVLMGNNKREWQDVDYILKFYDSKYLTARRRYREYVNKGFADGRRPELVGGGLVRSAGGWSVVKAMRRGFERMKGDERILGEGDFVETVLRAAQENIDRKSQLEAAGYSFDWLVGQVARQLEIEPKDVLAPGKYAQNVKARSLLCYWGTRELGMTTVDLARRLNLAQPTISQAVRRGQKIAEDQGLCLIEKSNQ